MKSCWLTSDSFFRYHSHPHITVMPSHVDVRTQAMYQTMDEGFIGLIFSVFNQVIRFCFRRSKDCTSITASKERQPHARMQVTLTADGSVSCALPVLLTSLSSSGLLQDGDKNQRIQMTAFQSQQQGSPPLPGCRGSWDFDSPMAAAISASMEGKSGPDKPFQRHIACL